MKFTSVFLVIGVAAALAGCNDEPPPPPVPTPIPTPIPTPHPATGAQEAARKLYPELRKPDSLFTRTFNEVYEDMRVKQPVLLTEVDWPLRVARRTGEILNIDPSFGPTPEPLPPKATPRTLERGAYNQTRSMTRRGSTPDAVGGNILNR